MRWVCLPESGSDFYQSPPPPLLLHSRRDTASLCRFQVRSPKQNHPLWFRTPQWSSQAHAYRSESSVQTSSGKQTGISGSPRWYSSGCQVFLSFYNSPVSAVYLYFILSYHTIFSITMKADTSVLHSGLLSQWSALPAHRTATSPRWPPDLCSSW